MIKSLRTLSNGLRIYSAPESGHFVSVGLYSDAGTRVESKSLAHFLGRASFKSTKKSTRSQMNEKLESLGGNFMCASSRENLIFQGTAINSHKEAAVSLIAEAALDPLFTDSELEETKNIIEFEFEESQTKHEFLIQECLHNTAYAGKQLGNKSVCLENISKNELLEWRTKHLLNTKNLVLTSVGIPIDELESLANKYFGDSSLDHNNSHLGSSNYIGGSQIYKTKEFPLAHFSYSFESVPFNNDDIFATSVLQTLLGGGDSFSAGGPGKGMHSSNTPYSDSGLFQFNASIPVRNIPRMIDIIHDQIILILNKGISDIELLRAKNQLACSLFLNLESKLAHAEDLGRQILIRGKPMENVLQRIDLVRKEDIYRVLLNMIKKNSTFVVVGDVNSIPDVKALEKKRGFRQ